MPKITWTEDPTQLGNTWRSLERENSHRLLLNKAFRRLYFDLPNTALINPELPYREWAAYTTLEQSAYNITRMVIDSVAPTVCEPLRVVVQPVGADYQTEKSCGDMGAAVAGVMDAIKYWDICGPLSYRDGSASDIGTVLGYVDGGGEIRARNIDPNDVRWHFDEGRDPLHLYFGMRMPRAGLVAQYPGHDKEIEGLPEYRQDTEVGVEYPGSRSGDCVQIVMAYRRAHDGEDGKCVVIGLGNGNPVLFDGPWKFDFFPAAHWRYDWDSQGFGGYAGARVLAPYHMQSDRLLHAAYDGLEGAVPTIMANELEKEGLEFSTKAWRSVFYRTNKPDVFIPKGVSEQVLAEINKLKDTAFFAYGQSMQAAQGLRPAGLNSAPAQREWVDIKNQRMARLIGNYKMMATDFARIIVAMASEVYKNKKILAKAPGSNMFREIKWPKDLREDKYQISFEEASNVPDTQAGRVQTLDELRDRGSIGEAEYLRGKESPNIRAIIDRLAAPADYVDMQINKALEDGVLIMPDAMQGVEGLDMLVTKGSQDYQRVQASGKNYPATNLRCLRRLIQAGDIRRKGLKATVPMPVPAVLPGQAAGVAPMPSSILPPAQPGVNHPPPTTPEVPPIQ
jgi:hypothetical protein